MEVEQDVAELRKRFRELGYYRRPTGRMVATFAVYVAIGLAAMVAFLHFPSLAARAATLVVATLSFFGAITLAHTAAHKAASDSDTVNAILTYLANPILHGLSARYWIHSHVTVHHPSPNVVGVDADCDLRPFFVLNEEHVRQGGVIRRKLLVPLQGLLLPLILPFNGFNMQKHGWVFLAKELFGGDGAKRRGALVDVACLAVHFAIFLALPMLFFAPSVVIALYAARITLCGIVMFAVLAPGHFPRDARVLAEDQGGAGDFYLRQTAATTNFRAGVVGDLLVNGLGYQIEHHLFPSICHVHYAKVRPHVQALCARHGLPYSELGWARAVWDSYVTFVRPKPVVADVETTRVVI